MVACGLGAALLVAGLLGWPFALRFPMARPELEAIAQRVLLTGAFLAVTGLIDFRVAERLG